MELNTAQQTTLIARLQKDVSDAHMLHHVHTIAIEDLTAAKTAIESELAAAKTEIASLKRTATNAAKKVVAKVAETVTGTEAVVEKVATKATRVADVPEAEKPKRAI